MARVRSSKRPMSAINVVPYIDVMLVLLVIFMVTAPMLQQGVTVDLPNASATPVDTRTEEPLIVSVDATGQYYLEVGIDAKKPMELNIIAARVAAIMKHKPDKTVLVRGDEHVPYGQVVSLMSILKKAGVPTVGLLTEVISES